MNPSPLKPLYITSGEPAGIGPDICLDLAGFTTPRPLVVLANKSLLQQRATELGKTVTLLDYQGQSEPASGSALYVKDLPLAQPVTNGQLNSANAVYVLAQLTEAARACMRGDAAGVVTAPVQKSVINEAGSLEGQAFSGHTEFFQEYAGVPRVVMMLATHQLRVALVTTHLPLKDVAAAITKQRLTQILDILIHDLKTKFAISHPKILVCGLNPHAGEGGYLGREEIDVIEPVLASYRAQGIDVGHALPADTLFTPKYLKDADAVLAMYHDQGLPVLKSQGFGEAVNITLGLPFIRTSVDHGTALDLAGSGKASSSSLFVATELALQLADRYEATL
ncbi:4-hydroxythreonine-4-phosphate dehydrogenase PdxA [Alkanindiges illinoisensis]|uniref:4-hydroxythreonine-4-phosphate dehydrogenase PdxA n=1 Tax=Alkanindiges illinoisensis TaxID=197183 RepID=UPI00047A620D|nr:4-hydroxythreonine-4-phosphate dehydrogenase PdxA [Alkanindiges illinoisensis]